MIWPSGLLSGSDIFSTRSAMIRLTATSSGASTSRARLPETSRTRTRVEGMCSLLSDQARVRGNDEQQRDSDENAIPPRRGFHKAGVLELLIESADTEARTDQQRPENQIRNHEIGRFAGRIAREQ